MQRCQTSPKARQGRSVKARKAMAKIVLENVNLFVNLFIVKEIVFSRKRNRSSPIEEFLDDLNSKQAQKNIMGIKVNRGA